MAAVKRALIVRIHRYVLPGANLRGCVKCELTMAKLLTENLGFNREDLRLLVDKRATTNIRSRLVFHFSGHGSQVRDRDGDELESGMDEGRGACLGPRRRDTGQGRRASRGSGSA